MIGLVAAGCAAQGNSFEDRLRARIDRSALGPDGSAEVRFSVPRNEPHFFQIYLNPSAVPDSVGSSYRGATGFLGVVDSALVGARFEIESATSGFAHTVELASAGPSVQWSHHSKPIYGFWSNWPGTELAAGDYVFRLRLPRESVQFVDSVTVERVRYETGP